MPDYPLDASIVITTYNQVRFTMQCFASLAATMKGLRYEIIVVDNGSTDETVPWIGAHSPGEIRGKAIGKYPPKRVTILRNPKPRALARSWNMGYDAAIGKHVFICNNDIMFGDESIQRMIALAEKDDSIGVVVPVCPLALRRPGFMQHAKPDIAHPYRVSDWTGAVVTNIPALGEWSDATRLPATTTYMDEPYLEQGGFCFMVTRPCWERVGRFDEDYVLTAEDWDYFHRTRRYFKIARPNNAYVHHFENQSIEAMPKGEALERYVLNRFLLTEKREGCAEYFSIIMPTYNREHTLIDAIESVIAQRFPHWRLYVIDDGSANWPKVSSDLWHRYATSHARIGFLSMPCNMGPAAARNYGLSICKGKYVAFLDSDDEWYADHLEVHWKQHESNDCVMAYSNPDFAWKDWDALTNKFRVTAAKHPTITYFGPFDKERLCKANYIQTSAMTVRGDIARRFRFPEHLRLAEDWDYMKELTDAGGDGRNVVHINQATCRYNFCRSSDEELGLVRQFIPSLNRLHPDSAVIEAKVTPKSPFTVVIATQNRPDKLDLAIRSAGDVPVIVCDDGSNRFADVKAAVRQHRNVTLFRREIGKGASAARNLAMRAVKTPWVKFLDDDDQLMPGWDQTAEKLLTDTTDAIVFSAFVPNGSGGLKVDNQVFTSQICARLSAVLAAGGFDETCAWAEERDLIDRLRAAGSVIVTDPSPICLRPDRGGAGDPATEKARIRQDAHIPSGAGGNVMRFGSRRRRDGG